MVAPPPAPVEASTQRFLTLRLDGRHYALPASQIAEVIRLQDIARVPQAPSALLGVINLRGSVLPVASLRALLGMPETPNARAIVLTGAAPVAVSVDAVEALVTIDAGGIEMRPVQVAALPGETLVGAFVLNDGKTVVKILDIAALVGAAFVSNSRSTSRAASGLAFATGHGSAAPPPPPESNQQSLLTFDVAGQEYALQLDAVHEIVDAPNDLAVLPGSEQLVLGVASFRDTLLPLLSLRGLLGIADDGAARSGAEKVVIARLGDTRVGLLADRMRTIFTVDPALMEDVPPLLEARAGAEARVTAIYRGENGRRLVALLSPEKLFREDVMQRLRASGPATRSDMAQMAGPHGEERQFVVFRLGDGEFGLPVNVVDEVALVPQRITRLPKTPKFLAGVINLRGEVLPVVDQRQRFDLPARTDEAERRLLVVRTERHRAGLIVDSVSEVLRCLVGDIEPAPNLTGEAVRLVNGVINLEQAGRMVMLLDPAELLTRAERGLLDAFAAKAEKAAL